MRRPIPQVQTRIDPFPLQGGLDLHTPQLQLKPGYVRDALNFECSINGGYTRIPGYERYDGRPSPTDAVVGTLAATAVAGLAVGDSINGQASGATGVVAAVDGTTVVYTKATGTFTVGENLREGVTVIGVITEVGVSVDLATSAEYTLAAANIYRADILAVPGSGQVRGGFTFNGEDYAFRNNAGGTALVMHRATSGGWTAVAFDNEVSFTAGGAGVPAEGATLTQGANTATIKRVVLQSGSFAGSTAAGRLIISTPAPGNFAAGAATYPGGGMTLSGAQTAITLSPGGRVETHQGNAGNGVRVYGCDGVNRGWEFDGTVFAPISTGQTSDAPTHVRVHKKHLFFSFGSSAQHSSIATPYAWTPLTGAAELAIDETISGYLTLPGDDSSAALAIVGENTVNVLYGTGSSTWNLVNNVGQGVGGKAYTARSLTQAYMFDDLGVVGLSAAQEFGNFSTAALTLNLRSFLQARRTLAVDALVNREKSQYRVFFSDGYGLFMTIVNGRLIGAMPVQFPDPVACAWSGESTNGGEVSFFGSTDGFVYRLDRGTSFDGDAIDSWFECAFAYQRATRVTKSYRCATFEVQGDGYAEFAVGYTLGYGVDTIEQPSASEAVQVNVQPAYWDQFTWDAFFWDGRALAPVTVPLVGTAENISLRVESSSALWPAYTVNSVTLQYTPRTLLRK